MINKIKNNKLSILLIILLLIISLNISQRIILKQELKIDNIAYNILVEKLRTPHLTTFMKIITQLSNPIIIVLITIGLVIFSLHKLKNKKIAILIPTNLTIITALNQILKIIFQRERPTGYRLIEMSGYSFPSGHAMVSMAFYGLLIYLISKIIKQKPLKIILIALNITIIILIGISRIYLGVHYLSDIITGYSLSIIYLLIITKRINKNNIIP